MNDSKHWLGLDIGGANLKAAMTTGYTLHQPFELWKRPERLPHALRELASGAPPHAGVAVTMTGELADCYASKAEGVASIIAAVEHATNAQPARYYAMGPGHRFLDAARARTEWRQVAAANWHALATVCAQACQHNAAVLVDVGSTTTDVIPLRAGRVDTPSLSDLDRLLRGELLYQGLGRTPVCSIVHELPYHGRMCPIAAENFATTLDAEIILGFSPPQDAWTADGRPATREYASKRIARLFCAHDDEFNERDALAAAEQISVHFKRRLVAAVRQVVTAMTHPPKVIFVSGEGGWLARATLLEEHLEAEVATLAEQIGDQGSRCAPAWAVAKLMEEGVRS